MKVEAFCLCAALCALPGAARGDDSGTVDLPDRNVVGKKPGSRFDEIRDRSRSVLEFRPSIKARDPNVAAEFVGERMLPGAQTWMYPAGSGYPPPVMTDAQAQDGRFSMEVSLK